MVKGGKKSEEEEANSKWLDSELFVGGLAEAETDCNKDDLSGHFLRQFIEGLFFLNIALY